MARILVVIIGHLCLIVGCYFITWGIYLLPESQPTFIGILTKPLFWGLLALLGGICTIRNAICKCVEERFCSLKKRK